MTDLIFQLKINTRWLLHTLSCEKGAKAGQGLARVFVGSDVDSLLRETNVRDSQRKLDK